MPKKSSIVTILWKYQRNEPLSPSEEDELAIWLKNSVENQLLYDELSNTESWNEGVRKGQNGNSEAVWKAIEASLQTPEQRKTRMAQPWKKYALAAAMISAFVFGTYGLVMRKRSLKKQDISFSGSSERIFPAVGHATLTLVSGRIVSLDTLGRGRLNSTPIWKTDSNSLAFLPTVSVSGSAELNSLTTSAGTQYRLVLPDSSTVWLNAGSRLQFPSAFRGRERKVILNGEGYFEVTKNSEKPFVVQSGNATITVLGTHFNIRNYENETAQKTTLLEGKVDVQVDGQSRVLMPGNQALVPVQGRLQVIPVNTTQAVAWRRNLFWFQSASFEEIMGELKRWYPVQVSQKGAITERFTGILPRNRPLAEVLKILETAGYVEFRLEGNDVEVMERNPK